MVYHLPFFTGGMHSCPKSIQAGSYLWRPREESGLPTWLRSQIPKPASALTLPSTNVSLNIWSCLMSRVIHSCILPSAEYGATWEGSQNTRKRTIVTRRHVGTALMWALWWFQGKWDISGVILPFPHYQWVSMATLGFEPRALVCHSLSGHTGHLYTLFIPVSFKTRACFLPKSANLSSIVSGGGD